MARLGSVGEVFVDLRVGKLAAEPRQIPEEKREQDQQHGETGHQEIGLAAGTAMRTHGCCNHPIASRLLPLSPPIQRFGDGVPGRLALELAVERQDPHRAAIRAAVAAGEPRVFVG